VTGATGFIGGHLSRYLRRTGWEIIALHRESSSSSDAVQKLKDDGIETATYSAHSDVKQLVTELQPQAVFHLAAHYTRHHEPSDVDLLIDANIALGTHILEAMVGLDCVMVNAVSYLQFRNNEVVPFSLYSATKQAFMDISTFYRRERGLDVRHVVLYDNFGPNDTRDKLITTMVNSLRDNELMNLGPAKQQLNLLYIDDLVSGLESATGVGNPDVMTIRSTNTVSVASVVSMLEDVAGRQLGKNFDSSRAILDHVHVAGSWPRPLTWAPAWTLQDGLAATFHSHK
jgi:CDP-paratose synthetase